MAEATEEQIRHVLPDDDLGLVTEAKALAAVERIVQLAHPLRVVAFGSQSSRTASSVMLQTPPPMQQ